MDVEKRPELTPTTVAARLRAKELKPNTKLAMKTPHWPTKNEKYRMSSHRDDSDDNPEKIDFKDECPSGPLLLFNGFDEVSKNNKP
mmetsp:Transcript_30622/g.46997  ORF Transcript_30622/g.46997 Transcript_30622/m.46997 type:complete len:86 (-) Transcript_30622:1011-1268(-)|eukprot:CAMPEP_0170500350 /NCGR_PEP_ID=MMETSP0208-20121228/34526_1 /TAXON_ID=197538 /ORGANISM="Strombidium inclinatum, Strain S3" /LENGTH=85 /DNA_ID=CAMNT_0010778353 /DNA_START=3151 /DNA_END=3408 /DNA_ORIENTATION=-